MPGPDPDDHVHSAAAIAAGVDALVTWNTKGFPVEPLTPAIPNDSGPVQILYGPYTGMDFEYVERLRCSSRLEGTLDACCGHGATLSPARTSIGARGASLQLLLKATSASRTIYSGPGRAVARSRTGAIHLLGPADRINQLGLST